ncbi:DUF1801 domain-containing protein [Dyadobacter luticola]|uniref:DUF1801 domain-containing protein n=1 Tax=Dyadobacter luticola TaxID=1979387 RepID=A0A5R9KTJ0_9BACT|nr:DUF1801 domain-containing protein [Dyadobacter luticola]TLU99520.1 DUF1801 domain-containing protein [Dyadobacter luticola]
MNKKNLAINTEVTQFLDELAHPLRSEIDALRSIILSADTRLNENIKWNGPNYSIGGGDRITMKILPPTKIQLIFHRGAKVKEQPNARLIEDENHLLLWKENDRAIATFNTLESIETSKDALIKIIHDWILKSVS